MDAPLADYLNQGLRTLVGSLVRTSWTHPRQALFLWRFSRAARRAEARRQAAGRAVPAFLIASVTRSCNLRCAGCYDQAHLGASEVAAALRSQDLGADRWHELFLEARNLGIPFIILAGGEPFTRLEVLERAARTPDVLFPVFTNGTLITARALGLLDRHRNLVPILSLEGDRDQTDARRGPGTYDTVLRTLASLRARGLLFGLSLTVTTENLETLTDPDFVAPFRRLGCRALVFVEYVPVTRASAALAPNDADRRVLEAGQDRLRAVFRDMLFVSFPGDEKASGGCLAAGRGFFHISSTGAAEPCPFSPHSDLNLAHQPLVAALDSPLFQGLAASGLLTETHEGGCVLFQKDAEVRALAARS